MIFLWLSHILSNETPLYGGADNLSIISDKSISSGDSCNTSAINLPSHAGTHVDAPNHFIPNGRTIDSYSPNEFIFKTPFVIDIDVLPSSLIKPRDIAKYDIPKQTDLIVFKTGFETFRGEDIFWQQNPGLAPELAEFLTLKYPALRAVGIDFISISTPKHREKGRVTHGEFLQRGILIFEDMRLCDLNPKAQLQKVIALPLRFQNGDGAPVSIIGVIDENI